MLELSIDQLKSLGFTIEDTSAVCATKNGYKIWVYALKAVGDSDAFFRYWRTQYNDSSPVDHEFSIDSSDGGDRSTVISKIESLERFYELEAVLNKK